MSERDCRTVVLVLVLVIVLGIVFLTRHATRLEWRPIGTVCRLITRSWIVPPRHRVVLVHRRLVRAGASRRRTALFGRFIGAGEPLGTKLAFQPRMDIADAVAPFTLVLERLPLKCREIMRQPVRTVSERETIQTAARLMREADVGFVPVCNRHGVVMGIVTDRDIATRVCAENEPAAHTTVSSVMTRGVITCRANEPISKAERLMRQHRITRILITDPLRHPVGVISLSDLVQYEPSARVKRTLQSVAERKYSPERP